jgi:D-alanyl-D-alanine carboxypeptidase/D-alanyl-D-alanine-endopeptidase (penicillin-binding protein 4)
LFAVWCCKGLWDLWSYRRNRFQVQETETIVVSADNPLKGRLPFWQVDSSKVAIALYDLTAAETVFEQQADRLMIPASCMKLLTAVTALKRLGPNAPLESRLLADGVIHHGTLYGNLIFEGDDDPLFESFKPMISALQRSGIQRIEGDVVLDLARCDTLRAHPTASPWDIPWGRLPLLLRGEPFVRRTLLYELSRAGINVKPRPLGASMPPLERLPRRIRLNAAEHHARVLAVERHPLREVLAPMLIHSSNIKAESVLWHVDNPFYRWGGSQIVNAQRPASSLWTFIREEMPKEDTAGFVINDGSGLSPDNRLTARFLMRLLIYAWDDESIREVLLKEALATPQHPVRRGSLTFRMSAPLFKDRVFCKTGTLTTRGASSLAGYIRSENNHWYAFAIINEDTPVWDARLFQDRICRLVIEP